jgi:hypothetical protein
MFTGALAASYYGTPRTTMDADVVIKVSSRDKMQSKLVSALREAGVKAEEHKINMAFESGFKIATFMDNRSPFTLDTIFSTRKLEKRSGTILFLPTFYQTPEELILAKLRMIKATIPRERAFKDAEDVKAILKFTRVDIHTIRGKAGKNNTLSTLKEILGETKK